MASQGEGGAECHDSLLFPYIVRPIDVREIGRGVDRNHRDRLVRGVGRCDTRCPAKLARSRTAGSRPVGSGSRPCWAGALPSAVVVTGLQEFNAILEHFVHQTIRFIDPTRPHIAADVFQRFRLANPFDGIPQHRLHQIEHTQRGFPIRIHPIPQIVQAFVLNDGVPRAFCPRAQGARSRTLRNAANSVGFFLPRRARVSAASKRTAFSGERSK